MVLGFCVHTLMLMLIFPFKVHVLLQGTLWSRTCNRNTQQFLHTQNIGSDMSQSKCLFSVLTVRVHVEFQVRQSGDDVIFSVCVSEVKSSVTLLVHTVADEPAKEKKHRKIKIVLCDKLQN